MDGHDQGYAGHFHPSGYKGCGGHEWPVLGFGSAKRFTEKAGGFYSSELDMFFVPMDWSSEYDPSMLLEDRIEHVSNWMTSNRVEVDGLVYYDIGEGGFCWFVDTDWSSLETTDQLRPDLDQSKL
jgi:hypothetical protein